MEREKRKRIEKTEITKEIHRDRKYMRERARERKNRVRIKTLPRNTNRKGRLDMADLFTKIACYVKV
jgi:hypothetical protein